MFNKIINNNDKKITKRILASILSGMLYFPAVVSTLSCYSNNAENVCAECSEEEKKLPAPTIFIKTSLLGDLLEEGSKNISTTPFIYWELPESNYKVKEYQYKINNDQLWRTTGQNTNITIETLNAGINRFYVRAIYADDTPGQVGTVDYNLVNDFPYGVKYVGPNTERFNNIIKTPDGGSIIYGQEILKPLENKDTFNSIILTRYAADLSLIWSKKIGGLVHYAPKGTLDYLHDQDVIKQVILTSDNNILIIGSLNSTDGNITGNHGWQDIFVTKLDLDGNILWQKCIGTDNYEEAASIKELPSGDIIIIGGAATSTTGVVISRLGKSGNTKWEKYYNNINILGTIYGGIKSVELVDDGIVLFGITDKYKFSISKVDLNGNLLWTKSITNNDLIENLRGVTQDAAGNFYITGERTTYQPNPQNNTSKAVLIKTDAIGNILLEKEYGGSKTNGFEESKLLANGDLLLTGYTTSNDGDVAGLHNWSDMWIVRVTPAGNILWQKCLDNFGPNVLLSDNSLVVAGKGYTGIIVTSINISTGLEQWSKLFEEPENNADYRNNLERLKEDYDGNIIGVGESKGDWGEDALILKLNKNTGEPMK